MWNRREFLKGAALAGGVVALPGLSGCAMGSKARGHVVVVGGGFGGATVAKYLRMWSQMGVDVTLVERSPQFISCPISNLVIGGDKQMADITMSYDGLRNTWGVKVLQDTVTAVDAGARKLTLASGGVLSYDRLVLSPGIEFMYDQVPGLETEAARDTVLHAWKAGAQTVALRKQLEDMKDGGVYALSIPKAPYRCPPGPYERACLVANYLQKTKPKSKVLVLDANEEITSKKGLFTKAFEKYKGILEYRPNSELREVDAASRTAVLEFDKVKADVLNVVPPQRAGDIAAKSGIKLINNRWVDIDWLSFESVNTPGVHVIGDAIFPAPTMPKSGHMANQHAKVTAAAIINLLAGEAPSSTPLVMNTCYSFVDSKNVIHVSSVHLYDAAKKTVMPVQGAGGVSAAANELEGKYALSWARNIWADMLV
ncbi:FCSD flavin-binding domain-containing protein [Zoogloea sp.]|jgi:sulfide dehydrogenase [flavocytochrome c] flavoprotein subunit|uniref:FCSD flavin-binding domain-containing protein n=1 Tax=Zoogloea sp. TaxID=49181 RepID=UPI001B62ADE3|nr:FCSD flavin-binding domain-containing protein [Zoogloea sp.]MBK6654195.1 FCSD flavin-binding domain-containing protein [Zoogloea sp.]MBP7444544.1 FCSD flavin-binding domain-containing protein [Zoogloea sp.]HOY02130.1 FCSD flavin-binding domain-containing protein [Zoogloea sp.]HPI59893.1 FCSD flavin-binding domain-containing protein [Zoogloea sp.]